MPGIQATSSNVVYGWFTWSTSVGTAVAGVKKVRGRCPGRTRTATSSKSAHAARTRIRTARDPRRACPRLRRRSADDDRIPTGGRPNSGRSDLVRGRFVPRSPGRLVPAPLRLSTAGLCGSGCTGSPKTDGRSTGHGVDPSDASDPRIAGASERCRSSMATRPSSRGDRPAAGIDRGPRAGAVASVPCLSGSDPVVVLWSPSTADTDRTVAAAAHAADLPHRPKHASARRVRYRAPQASASSRYPRRPSCADGRPDDDAAPATKLDAAAQVHDPAEQDPERRSASIVASSRRERTSRDKAFQRPRTVPTGNAGRTGYRRRRNGTDDRSTSSRPEDTGRTQASFGPLPAHPTDRGAGRMRLRRGSATPARPSAPTPSDGSVEGRRSSGSGRSVEPTPPRPDPKAVSAPPAGCVRRDGDPEYLRRQCRASGPSVVASRYGSPTVASRGWRRSVPRG